VVNSGEEAELVARHAKAAYDERPGRQAVPGTSCREAHCQKQ
jgi:hypothetical protein